MTSFAVAEFGGDGIRAEAETDFQGHELWGAGTRSFYAQAVVGFTAYTEFPLQGVRTHSTGLQDRGKWSGVVEVD